MTAKQQSGQYAPDGSLYITLTDGAGNLSSAGGGTPGGSNTQLQYNNSSAFGGTSGLTWDSTNKVVTLATVASNGNEGALIINGNAVAPTTADAHRTSIHIVAEDAGLPEIMFDGYGSHGSINFRNSGGTGASPAFTPTASDIFRIGARGRGTSVLTNTSAGIRAVTAENFTDTANGTLLILSSTAIGSAGNASGGTEAWRVQPSGGASIGDSTYNATDPGAGILAIKNGLKIGTTTETFPTSGNIVGTTDSQALTNKTINGNTFTAGTYTLTGTASKTLTFSNSITLAGTDSTTMTFPSTSASIARTDATQGLTGLQTISGGATLPSPVTANVMLQIANTTSAPAVIELDAFTATAGLTFRRANTSSTAPSAITSANTLANTLYQGYNGAGAAYVTGANIRAISTATTWDGSHNGAFLEFLTSPDGGGAAAITLRCQGSGGISIGSANATTDGGAGTVVATNFTSAAGVIKLASYTVATLPSASTSGAGATAFVTDASTTLILGLGGTVAGGGSNKVPVYSDGTNWIYG